MNRRNFIKKGALFMPMIFVPKLIRAATPQHLNAQFFRAKPAPAGGGGGGLPSGLISRWNFEEGSGSTANDSAGSNTGTLVNSPTYVAGKVGSFALSFARASSQGITVPYSSTLAPAQITVAYWMNLNGSPSAFDTMVSRKFDGVGFPYFSDMRGGSNLNPSFGSYNGSIHFVIANTSLSTGTWYHIAGTFDGAAYKIYINGTLDNTLTDSTALYGGTSLRLTIGCLDNAGTLGRFFNGTIDDVQIYNRALTQTEIAALP